MLVGGALAPAHPAPAAAPASAPAAGAGAGAAAGDDGVSLRPYACPPIVDEHHRDRLLSKTLSSHMRWAITSIRKRKVPTGVLNLSGLYPNLTELMKLCKSLELVQASADGPVHDMRLKSVGLRDDCRSTLAMWLAADVCLQSLDLVRVTPAGAGSVNGKSHATVFYLCCRRRATTGCGSPR